MSPPERERPAEGIAVLVRRYARGDESVFPELYRRSSRAVRAAIVRQLGHDRWAEDLVQQTYVLIHRGRRRCLRWERPCDERAWAWFRAIARNAALSWLRRMYRRPWELRIERLTSLDRLAGRATDAESRLLAAEADVHIRHSLDNALATLTPNLRSVVVLHKLEGLPMAEVSRRLGISNGAARVRAHRAYLAMREQMAPA